MKNRDVSIILGAVFKKEMSFMTEGILNKHKNNIYIDSDSRKFPVLSGQYLYLKVYNCWIPVIISRSEETGDWNFRYLEEIEITGQRVAF